MAGNATAHAYCLSMVGIYRGKYFSLVLDTYHNFAVIALNQISPTLRHGYKLVLAQDKVLLVPDSELYALVHFTQEKKNTVLLGLTY